MAGEQVGVAGVVRNSAEPSHRLDLRLVFAELGALRSGLEDEEVTTHGAVTDGERLFDHLWRSLDAHLETRLLADLAYDGLSKRLARLDVSAEEHPAVAPSILREDDSPRAVADERADLAVEARVNVLADDVEFHGVETNGHLAGRHSVGIRNRVEFGYDSDPFVSSCKSASTNTFGGTAPSTYAASPPHSSGAKHASR